MQVRDIMTRDVRLASPDDTVQAAAQLMADIDAGVLPVGENDRLVGLITDRDITTRVVAAGKAPGQCRVRDAMSTGTKYVYDDETTDDVARNMSTLQVRRLPVLNRDKRLVGIVSLADLATRQDGPAAGHAVRNISQPTA